VLSNLFSFDLKAIVCGRSQSLFVKNKRERKEEEKEERKLINNQ